MIFGCIGRIVTAFVLLILGALLWHFREAWVPQAKEFFQRKVEEADLPRSPIGAAAPQGVPAFRLAPGVLAQWGQG